MADDDAEVAERIEELEERVDGLESRQIEAELQEPGLTHSTTFEEDFPSFSARVARLEREVRFLRRMVEVHELFLKRIGLWDSLVELRRLTAKMNPNPRSGPQKVQELEERIDAIMPVPAVAYCESCGKPCTLVGAVLHVMLEHDVDNSYYEEVGEERLKAFWRGGGSEDAGLEVA